MRKSPSPDSPGPVFGSWVEGCLHVVRPSAYVLVQNSSDEIAVVRSEDGHFLPGGGIEAGETPDQAVVREAMEECGFVLSTCICLANAVEIVYSAKQNVCIEKRSRFFEASLLQIAPATEPGHTLLWLKRDKALTLLSHGSHRWVVEQLGSFN